MANLPPYPLAPDWRPHLSPIAALALRRSLEWLASVGVGEARDFLPVTIRGRVDAACYAKLAQRASVLLARLRDPAALVPISTCLADQFVVDMAITYALAILDTNPLSLHERVTEEQVAVASRELGELDEIALPDTDHLFEWTPQPTQETWFEPYGGERHPLADENDEWLKDSLGEMLGDDSMA